MIYVHQIGVQNETNEFKKNLIWKIRSITILEYKILNISNVISSYNNDNCEYNAMFLFLGYAWENQTNISFRLGYN